MKLKQQLTWTIPELFEELLAKNPYFITPLFMLNYLPHALCQTDETAAAQAFAQGNRDR